MVDVPAAHDTLPAVLAPEDVNLETLRAIYQSAYYPVSMDDDGDLELRSGGIWIHHQHYEGHPYLRFFTQFRAETEVTVEALHAAANAFNRRVRTARAFAAPRRDGGHRVIFEADINFEGGLSPMNLISCLRRFEAAVHSRREFADLLA